ncbi:hypothetical protein M409DRAFT_53160 [Zasmidium cellare ATCC 36951]|uniref:Uncharacterized protein n=1 Tax=Zasmidium cellare ATCC 36951 TaxID=1080233 RepID=A0A6A6CMX5_ZASCE|nr:uncharacterized protein M409DRAFT_53160 [Zasmidium cellare ATCC 36951]KAF2168494.1 hypothetical protein M409DRAFT_53160 [Zasmidium cellare ATCC 36951]
MSSNNPGKDYYNFAANEDFTIGHNPLDTSVFLLGDRVLVNFYDGDFAYGHIASCRLSMASDANAKLITQVDYHDKFHKRMVLSPGTCLVTPSGMRKSNGLSFKTAIITRVQRI